MSLPYLHPHELGAIQLFGPIRDDFGVYDKKRFLWRVRIIVGRLERNQNSSKTNNGIHENLCHQIRSAYALVHIHLSKCFEQPMITEEMFSTLKPVADNLVAVMMEGARFIEWCQCKPNVYHEDEPETMVLVLGQYEDDPEMVWMQRALYSGLSMEPIDMHIHNVLLAMCALGNAINRFISETDGGDDANQVDPAVFWGNDEARNPAYILIDGVGLENARNDDINQIRNDLKSIISRIGPQLEACAGEGDKLKWNLAHLLLEKLEYHEAVHQEDYSTTPHVEIPGIVQWADDDDDNRPKILSTLYRIENVTVSKARWRHAGPDKIFALKGLSLVEKYGFPSEARIHFQLHHPNIVQSLCAFVDGRECGYILMELMDWNLTQYIRDRKAKKMSLAEQIHVMLQISKGMEYLHSRGIMHRDLKPENVLITDSQVQPVQYEPFGASTSCSKYEQGLQLYESVQVKIADFNFAKTITSPISRSSLDSSTHKVGTTIYRAPEVLKGGEGLNYCKEVDVYSFGAVCFMMFLIGSEEYEEGVNILKMIQKGRRRPQPLNVLRGKCPWYLQRWIEAWLDPNPMARPTFKDICRVLRHLHSVVIRSGPTFPPFLSEPVHENAWRAVQERVRREMQRLERFKEEKEWQSHSSVVEIPYEMHLMNVMESLLNRSITSSSRHPEILAPAPAPAPAAKAKAKHKHNHKHKHKPEPQPIPKPKPGVLGCFLARFQLCRSKTPIPVTVQAGYNVKKGSTIGLRAL